MPDSSLVTASRNISSIPTYGVGKPEKNPVFFDKRVYQGSSGKVYPVPFIDKVHDEPKPADYDTVHLENEFVRLVMLPEIGGRIFLGQDKANRDYDFFYRQDVIKPALVGLAGPWISGGVEFNWPQHHRPGTFLPTDVHIEQEADGAKTVWLSEHDPINRLKGMHGIRLRPGSSLVELRASLYNRTPLTQTFLWWANVAAKVHDKYQSFFPPDVHYVADHALRAQSSFPVARSYYYGVDYASRAGSNDLSWYRNIPVPTSYMVCQSEFDFFGGYDYDAEGGFIHVADRNISPGKKQWTWGNHDFGWAWDRELTDANGPYVELMAGVYTDNQPDFSYLLPYEKKTFSQFWWPFKKTGPLQNATVDAAIRLVLREDRSLDLGVVVSRKFNGARIVLRDGDKTLIDKRVDICPESPWQNNELLFQGNSLRTLELTVTDDRGTLLCSYRPVDSSTIERTRGVATEPPLPEEVGTMEELYLTAEHLEQYRHPTRYPELYWEEALRRDPMEARTNIAYGRRKLSQGCLARAEEHFQKAICRLTHRHPNPYTGEAHYYLGMVRRRQGRESLAYADIYKATWNYTWRSAAYYELALIDCLNGNFRLAVNHAEASLDTNRQNNKAHVLKAIALRKEGREPEENLENLLSIDPLDHWARYESGDVDGFFEKCRNDAQTILDVAYDYAEAGCFQEASQLLQSHHAREVKPVAVPNPMERSPQTHYTLAWLMDKQAPGSGAAMLEQARAQRPDYFFPSRLHDQIVLEWALTQPGDDRNAAYALGNYYFDGKRHEDAIAAWQEAAGIAPDFATVRRNLGIAYWNVRRDGPRARTEYQQALESDPDDARIFYEYDQLQKKLKVPVIDRLEMMQSRPDLVARRDDASVEMATLYNQAGQPQKALDLLLDRRFHPWEGGEGQVLRQYTTARLQLGENALVDGKASAALEHFEKAMQTPTNLGEAYHLLQARADVNYWLGRALRELGREEESVSAFQASAEEAGDFQAMAVTAHSELSYFRGLSLIEMARLDEAENLFEDLKTFAQRQRETPARIDYFATSLPLLLVFEDDLDESQRERAEKLLALARTGLEQVAAKRKQEQ